MHTLVLQKTPLVRVRFQEKKPIFGQIVLSLDVLVTLSPDITRLNHRFGSQVFTW